MNSTRRPHNQDASDAYISYVDDGALVITEKTNPNAWIKSDVTVSLEDIEDDRQRESLPER